MQLLLSIVFTLLMAVWTIGFGFVYCVVCPFLPFRGRFWMAGVLTHVVFFMLRVICGLTYRVEGRDMRSCHPRDLVERCRDICRYESRPFALTPDLMDRAWIYYFGAEPIQAEGDRSR